MNGHVFFRTGRYPAGSGEEEVVVVAGYKGAQF